MCLELHTENKLMSVLMKVGEDNVTNEAYVDVYHYEKKNE